MALISGCGAGIGEASARLFAEHGAVLWLNDLRAAELNRVVDELAATYHVEKVAVRYGVLRPK